MKGYVGYVGALAWLNECRNNTSYITFQNAANGLFYDQAHNHRCAVLLYMHDERIAIKSIPRPVFSEHVLNTLVN